MSYGLAWYQSLGQYRPFNERALWAVFAHLGKPESYLDMGCGDGWMVRTARLAGAKPSIGIEVSKDAKRFARRYACVFAYDLTKPMRLPTEKFDLVTSIEVGEHLKPEGSEVFVQNLVTHCGRYLVFTAAIPGQGGEGHINCQPPEYWRELITQAGMIYEPDLTERLRETWKWTTGPMFWLPQNLQVFSTRSDNAD